MRTALTALVLGALSAFGALTLRPASAAAQDADSDQLRVRLGLRDVFPPKAVTDLIGVAGGEGQAVLQWSSPASDDLPKPKPEAVAQYLVRVASFPASDLGGDTTAWFDAADPLAASAPLAPGSDQAILTSLQGGTSYWFGLRSVDAAGLTSLVDVQSQGVATQVMVPVKGVAGVTNLTAVPGPTDGSVSLTWTTPRRIGQLDPSAYEVRVSSLGQISDSAEFEAALPLTAFSPSPLPGLASPGLTEGVTLTGLVPSATYYFALRARDAGLPAFKGVWRRSVPLNLNPLNFAAARFNPGRPTPVTDLYAEAGAAVGEINVAWTAPDTPNLVALQEYRLKMSTRSVADLGGDATAWFDLAESTTFVVAPVNPVGSREALTVSGLNQQLGTFFFFGVKTINVLGEVSFIDLTASGVSTQAKSRPRNTAPILNLTATPVPAESGRIDLAWTSPNTTGLVAPLRYLVRVSTSANLQNNAEFDAARPLSAFSQSEAPAVSSGLPTAFPVTGLVPMATYYFAVRVEDSNSGGALLGDWIRSVSSAVNSNNFAVAPLIAAAPDAVTDLAGVGSADRFGAVDLSWTAPRNQNFSPVTGYQVRFTTYSVSDLAADATAWYEATAASQTLVSDSAPPGAAVALSVSGLRDGELYFFAVRAVDNLGVVGPVDLGADAGDARPQASARPNGVGPITDLTALPDGDSGSVDLVWTTPLRTLTNLPERYVMRVSTAGNIEGDGAFAAARPLSAFSATPLPAVGAAFSVQNLTLTGLSPFTTYFFALAVEDSSAPVKRLGAWLRDGQRNVFNFANPSFQAREPDPISDLSALPGSLNGEVLLAWTAPRNQNFVAISSYTVRAATFPVTALAGDATAWFNAAGLSYVYYPANVPGSAESLVLSGLDAGVEYFFGLRAFDQLGTAGLLDAGLDGANPLPQASGRSRGLAGVTDLAAASGAGAGIVDLSWTAPARVFPVNPERYTVKMSTLGQISSDADFAAAKPLSAFSSSPLPAVGAAASRELFSVTGLAPFTTYYFALRVEDSSAPVVNLGRWQRDVTLGRNVGNFGVPSFFANLPEPITDLTALPGAQEGAVALSWTAPRNKNLMPIVRYEVRFGTFPVSALAGDATAWFNLQTTSAPLAPAQAPGAVEQLSVGGLFPSSTFYFAVRSVDVLGETSFVDTGADASDPRPQAFVKPLNLPPAVPAGLTTLNGLKRVGLSWTDLPAGLGGKGLDFTHYRVQRSTDDAQFVTVTTQAGVAYTDRPLRAETTFYFRLSARDSEGLESAPSPSVSALPFTLAPQEPFGLRFSRDGSSITLSWAPTTRFESTEPFYDPAAPFSDELSGYSIYRSTGACSPFAPFAAYGLSVASHTEADIGQSAFYKVMAVNDFKVSTAAVVLSPFGDQIHSLPDCASGVTVPELLSRELLGSVNGTGKDIYIKKEFHLEQNGGEVLQTVEFRALSDGGEPIKNFAFKKPVRIAVRYQTDGSGKPVPASAQSVSADAAAAAQGVRLESFSAGAADEAKNLGLYWNDNKEYKKIYGQVDPLGQTVTAETPNIGAFQVRRVFRDSAATFDLSNITTRVITPNGDGKNDLMIMLFDNPKGASVSGSIFDLRGAKVASMAPGPNPDSLQWDGMMNGKPVTSGVYVYQVEGDGKLFNGTCVVAR
ncbi:MAG: gliding motility-associated C-terminal domain-containing protein [Elusimicrobia bacterium]|nr:gliding motility-associated C-terminal domain-containing protein [Elusimicrobiota bacterium]